MSNLFQRKRFARDHRWTATHLSPYIEGELSNPARSRLFHHIAECPECRSVLASLHEMLSALARLRSVDPSDPDQVVRAVRARMRESSSRGT